MAAAEIIGTAIGVMLLIIIAYILTGSTLMSAETMANAQKDLTLQNEARLRTIISPPTSIGYTSPTLIFSVTNNGSEIISDFEHMDIFTWDGSSSGYQHYVYDTSWHKTIVNDLIHPNQLDPGETLQVQVTIAGSTPPSPKWFQITTSNGVSASASSNVGWS